MTTVTQACLKAVTSSGPLIRHVSSSQYIPDFGAHCESKRRPCWRDERGYTSSTLFSLMSSSSWTDNRKARGMVLQWCDGY